MRARRDDVVRKRQPGQRVADGGGAEVAGTLRLREHQQVGRRAGFVAVALVVAEAEQLVLHDRPAEGAAELVLLEHRLGLGAGREVVARLQGVVAVGIPTPHPTVCCCQTW
jgi:hypothetical protein